MGTAFSPLSLLLVALGGAAGSVLRYAISHAGVVLFGTGFPWGTLAANILGSALIGVFGGLGQSGFAFPRGASTNRDAALPPYSALIPNCRISGPNSAQSFLICCSMASGPIGSTSNPTDS